MTLDANHRLTYTGIEAAEDISHTLEEKGQRGATRRAEEEYGWEALGSGIARIGFEPPVVGGGRDTIAFEVDDPDEEYVQYDSPYPPIVKVGTPWSGQNTEAIDNWRRIDGEVPSDEPWYELKDYVAPITDYDSDKYMWIVMPKGDTSGRGGGRLEQEIERKTGFFVSDLHNDNVAMFDRLRVIDMGSDIAYHGTVDTGAWDSFMSDLRTYGLRDVYKEMVMRDTETVYFRHPTRLPGSYHDADDSSIDFSKGGNLVAGELQFPLVPSKVASITEIKNMLDEVNDVEEVVGRASAEVEDTPRGRIPKVTLSGDPLDGPELQEVSEYLGVVYDRYDQIFTPAFNEAGVDEGAFRQRPSDVSSGQQMLGDIMSDFEGLIEDDF